MGAVSAHPSALFFRPIARARFTARSSPFPELALPSASS
jgi:hypothetical protein